MKTIKQAYNMINHTKKLRETEVGCSQKYGSSEIWSDNNPPNLRSLAKYHTEKWRVRRSIKASVSSDNPKAALCLVPKCPFIAVLVLVGNTAPAHVILLPCIITPPSCRRQPKKPRPYEQPLERPNSQGFLDSLHPTALVKG